MKRKRILRSTPAYPQVIRSRRYYADMDQISHEAAVAKERRMREAAAANSAADPSEAPQDNDNSDTDGSES